MKHQPQTFTLDVAGILVTVTRKNIRHMHLRVGQPDGRVTVSAPFFMSDHAIAEFVESKSNWIRKHAARFAAAPRPAERRYETGEAFPVWGRAYTLRTEHGSRYALRLSGDAAVLSVRAGSTAPQRERFAREWYRGQLETETAKRLPAWEQATGLRARSWQTKAMKTRWGSCNTKAGRIWLNVRLAEKPPACLDYVILHELLHLAERGHNARFYALLDRYMPDWRAVKKQLNGMASPSAE